MLRNKPTFEKQIAKTKMKLINYILLGLLLILYSSCGVETYRTFETGTDKVQVFNDKEIGCDFSQVIYDNSSTTNIYINFKPKRNTQIEIEDIAIQINWRQNDKVIKSPLTLSSINIGMFEKDYSGQDSTFKSYSTICDKFKKILSKDNSLLYNLEFSDTSLSFIPKDVDRIYIELNIKIKSEQVMKQFNKKIELKSNTHHYFWIFRDC